MTIQKLPQTSIRALGSTQAITSPLSVLKELIENALDANATSIAIEITPDLLSLILVKDNGTGIKAEDREFMAKPHCTSKLENFEDLSAVATLGFRGEALASIAVVANLEITTKTELEKIATSCDIAKDGSIQRQAPQTALRGTTVRVSKLFCDLPVRRANVEKTAQKLLPQIRPLIQSYYLTHYHVRFSLKSVSPPQGNKGKKNMDEKWDISYPSSKSFVDAISKCLGKVVVTSGEHSCFPQPPIPGSLQLNAFTPKLGADVTSISKKGVFISLNNRPLSTSRQNGVAKKIYGCFKSYLRNSYAENVTITEPYLLLNIITSPEAADVNIEPAKDDVLLADTDGVVGSIERYFEQIYGSLEPKKKKEAKWKTLRGVVDLSNVDFNLLISGRDGAGRPPSMSSNGNIQTTPPPSEDIHPQTIEEEGEEEEENEGEDDGWVFNMHDSGLNEDEKDTLVRKTTTTRDTLHRPVSKEQEETASTSNPWIKAKMNAPVSSLSKPSPNYQKSYNESPTITYHSSDSIGMVTPSIQQHSNSSASLINVSRNSQGLISPFTERSYPEPLTFVESAAELPASASSQQSKKSHTRMSSYFPTFGSKNPNSTQHINEVNSPVAADTTQLRRRKSSSDNMQQSSVPEDEETPHVTRQKRTSQQRIPPESGSIDTWLSNGTLKQPPKIQSSMEPLKFVKDKSLLNFGRPEIRASNKQGDGGRGIFLSARDAHLQMIEESRLNSEAHHIRPISPFIHHKNGNSSSEDDEGDTTQQGFLSNGSQKKRPPKPKSLERTPAEEQMNHLQCTLPKSISPDFISYRAYIKQDRLWSNNTSLVEDQEGLAESVEAWLSSIMENPRNHKHGDSNNKGYFLHIGEDIKSILAQGNGFSLEELVGKTNNSDIKQIRIF